MISSLAPRLPDAEPTPPDPDLIATLDQSYADALGYAEQTQRDYGEDDPAHAPALARCRAAYIAMVSARVARGFCIGWDCQTQHPYPGLCLTCALSDSD